MRGWKIRFAERDFENIGCEHGVGGTTPDPPLSTPDQPRATTRTAESYTRLAAWDSSG